MVKAIIFDLGRVLVPFDFTRGYDRMAALCPYTAQEIPERLRQTDLVAKFESGQIAPEDFVARMSEILELQSNYSQFCEIWSSVFLPYTLIPESLVEALHRRYRTVLLSNTNAIHYSMIKESYPILRHFDSYVLSYEVGAMKPSPLIYNEAIRQSACEAGECFFTDDVAAYVEGARREGIDAVQFENHEQIERELRARGVEW
jgi:glucose-1-phosphatase